MLKGFEYRRAYTERLATPLIPGVIHSPRPVVRTALDL